MVKKSIPVEPGFGIPDPTQFGEVTSLPVGQEVPFVVQEHRARRAGKHFDVRFGPDRMFSFATRKGLPEPGGKVKLFQTPLHEAAYAEYEGPLKGYGAGTVKKHLGGTVLITNVTPKKISFVTAFGKYPQRITMIRDPKNPTQWLAVNTTPADTRKLFGRKIPAGSRVEEALGLKKERYKKYDSEKINDLDQNVIYSRS